MINYVYPHFTGQNNSVYPLNDLVLQILEKNFHQD